MSFSGNVGIIGSEQSDIIFFHLQNGVKHTATKIYEAISSLKIYHDTQLDTVTLLITNINNDQWQLILEKPCTKYIYPLNTENSALHGGNNDNETDNDESKNFPTTRSRLRGLTIIC